jgi:hypothetical protein
VKLVKRRRRKRRSSNLILWAGLVLLIAGFLARRALLPRALHYATHRPGPSENSAPADSAASTQPPAPIEQDETPSPAQDPDTLKHSGTAPPQAQTDNHARPAARELFDRADRRSLNEVIRRRPK